MKIVNYIKSFINATNLPRAPNLKLHLLQSNVLLLTEKVIGIAATQIL